MACGSFERVVVKSCTTPVLGVTQGVKSQSLTSQGTWAGDSMTELDVSPHERL